MGTQIKVGDIVKGVTPMTLHCATYVYPHAVCMSVEPLILVSESADMRWSQMTPEKIESTGVKVDDDVWRKCLTRLTDEEALASLQIRIQEKGK